MATDTILTGRQEWADRLERDGYVEFRRRRWPLVRAILLRAAVIAAGVAIGVTWAEHTVGFVGGFTIAVMGAWSILDTLPRPGRGAALRADRTGITVRRWRPIQVPWSEIVTVAGSSKAVYVEVLPETLIRWAGRRRRARRAAAEMSDVIKIADLAAPMTALADWLDAETDRQVPLSGDIGLWLTAVADDGPLVVEATGRSLPLDRIGLQPDVADRLASWRSRSSAGLDPALPAEERVAAAEALAAEGRTLATEIAGVIGPHAGVRLVEDALADPAIEREGLALGHAGREWAAQLERDGQVGFSRSWQFNLFTALLLPAFSLLPLVWVVGPFVNGWSVGSGFTFALGALVLPPMLFGSVTAASSVFSRSPMLRVDATGISFGRRRKSFLPWSGIIEVWVRPMGHGVEAPAVRASRSAIATLAAGRPWWLRWFPARMVYVGQDVVIPYAKRSQTADLVAWLNWELAGRAPLPQHMVMLPADRAVFVCCRETSRAVPLLRLPMRESTVSSLREWNRRAAPLFADRTLPPALAAEARTLAAQIQADLPAGSTMTYFEDVPEPP